MTKVEVEESGGTFKIESKLDEAEGMTLRDPSTGATVEISEIADETAREYVSSLPAGKTVRVELTETKETPTITGVKPTAMPERYGSEYTVENCCM